MSLPAAFSAPEWNQGSTSHILGPSTACPGEQPSVKGLPGTSWFSTEGHMIWEPSLS